MESSALQNVSTAGTAGSGSGNENWYKPGSLWPELGRNWSGFPGVETLNVTVAFCTGLPEHSETATNTIPGDRLRNVLPDYVVYALMSICELRTESAGIGVMVIRHSGQIKI